MSLKPIIKSAREALDKKDYQYALQLCTDALAFEPDNFWLLVFRAVALGNVGGMEEEALKEYQKASRVQSDNPTAFQGIVNLYESNGLEFDERYHSSLERLCSILYTQKEHEKHFTLMMKRLKLHKESKNIQECLKIFNWFTSTEALQFYPPSLLPKPFSILKEQFNLMNPIETAQIAKDIETGRIRLSANDPIERLIDRCTVQNYSKDLTQIIKKLSEIDPENYFDMLIRRLLRIVLSDFCVTEELRVEYASELIRLVKDNTNELSLYIKYNINCDIDADVDSVSESNLIPDTMSPGPRNIFNSLLSLSEPEDHLKLFNELEGGCKRWNRAFNIPEYSKFTQKALKFKLKALISLNYYEEALESCGQFTDEDLLDDLIFEPVLFVLEYFNNLSRSISLIEAKLIQIDPEHPGIILKLVENLIETKRFDEAKEYLNAIKEAYPSADLDNETLAKCSFSTGLCSWHSLNDKEAVNFKEETLQHFLSAAKLNPTESKYFTWIGKFYWRIERDTERSKKCFIKALHLDSSNFQAALLFSEISLVNNSDFQSIVDLLKPFVKQSLYSRNRKLFYFYGVALFHVNNYLDSSIAFQSALKSSFTGDGPIIEDLNCLQWLGESYLKSNRLGSAAKAFNKLASSSVYGKVGLASVYLKSNNPIDAVDILDSIQGNYSHIPKISLDKSEALISLARHYLRQGRFISAMKTLLRSLQILSNFPTHSDALRMSSDCFVLANLFKSIFGFPFDKFKAHGGTILDCAINPGLVEISKALDGMNECTLSLIGAKFALAAVSEAFKKSSDLSKGAMATYWIQLAICLSKFENMDEFTISAAETALKTPKCSISTASEAHHLLALIYCNNTRNYRLAQHHFISALKYRETSPVWTDLGRFYVKAGDWELAVEAFKKALGVDPEDLVAAFELSKCGGSLEGQEAGRQVAQRAFSTQPVLFTEEFAFTLASYENPYKEIAFVYLHRLHPKQPPIKQDHSVDIPEFQSKSHLLAFLNEKSEENPGIWLSRVADEFDCEYLMKRPENELTQSGWRAVVEGLLPISKERTNFELGQLV